MDFTQAYDRIDRSVLWAHLASIGMPPHLLQAIQGMYSGDTYTLVEGPKRTSPVHPTHGVKQGCPLSPLLFSLFINDFAARHAHALHTHGVPLRSGSRVVSHMFYADDLALMACSIGGLHAMLEALEEYADQKGLTVNAGKSEIVVFNSRSPIRYPESGGLVRFRYGDVELAIKSEFKYLGFTLHSTLNMAHTHAPRARGLMASMSDVVKLGRELGMAKSPWAMVKLFQTYVCPLICMAVRFGAPGLPASIRRSRRRCPSGTSAT